MEIEEYTLTAEQQDDVRAWLEKYPVSHQHNDWIVYGALVWITAHGGRWMPQVMIVCLTCGCTLYFNAKILGIVPWQFQPDPFPSSKI